MTVATLDRPAGRAPWPRLPADNRPALAVLALLALVTVARARAIGLGYDGGGGLTLQLALLSALWIAALVVRASQPSRIAQGAEAYALFCLLSLLSALATTALAFDGGPFVDAGLAAADRRLFGGTRWIGFAFDLPGHPRLRLALCYAYVSLNWQPLLALGALVALGRIDALRRFVMAWGLGLAGCVLPFHWWPARAAYLHYGVEPAALHGMPVQVAWDAIGKLDALRSGAAGRRICVDTLGGFITFPSFHACAAVLLAWAFLRMGRLGLPMLLLNAAMLVSAIPIGGHYVVDLVAGVAVAVAAVLLAERWAPPPAGARPAGVQPDPAASPKTRAKIASTWAKWWSRSNFSSSAAASSVTSGSAFSRSRSESAPSASHTRIALRWTMR